METVIGFLNHLASKGVKLSVEAGQLMLICELLVAVAVRLAGAVGGVVSGAPASVVAVAIVEFALRFPAASVARRR